MLSNTLPDNNIRLTLSLTEKHKNNSVAVQSCPFSVCVNTDYVFHSFIFAVLMLTLFFLSISGVRQEQDLFVRLIDSVTKAVSTESY